MVLEAGIRMITKLTWSFQLEPHCLHLRKAAPRADPKHLSQRRPRAMGRLCESIILFFACEAGSCERSANFSCLFYIFVGPRRKGPLAGMEPAFSGSAQLLLDKSRQAVSQAGSDGVEILPAQGPADEEEEAVASDSQQHQEEYHETIGQAPLRLRQ